MNFTSQQEQAIMAVARWFRKRESPIFRLFGYAGTGKSTLARCFAEIINGEVQFATFTGKAAQVLRSKGIKNARTIHSLIYYSYGEEELLNTKTGKIAVRPAFVLKKKSSIARADLVVIDESSMIDKTLAQDLLVFGIPILALGDPYQLPPITGKGFFTDCKPDFLLTEIHRQAYNNPIIRLALQARLGQNIEYGDYGVAKVISRKEIAKQMILEADQVLVGTNNTRRVYNQHLRELKGYTAKYPQKGEKLVCLRNDPTKNLLNGSLWEVITSSKEMLGPSMNLVVRTEGETQNLIKIKILKKQFEGLEKKKSWSLRKKYDDFDYGYALTVHKAQGSQWNNVILFDESFFFRETASSWLYTGITRAAKNLILVR